MTTTTTTPTTTTTTSVTDVVARANFALRFLAPELESGALTDPSWPGLLAAYSAALDAARLRWSTIDVAREWAVMDEWLTAHGVDDTVATLR